jgi:predicted Zn-dependent peptidase
VLARLVARELRRRLREQLGATYGVHPDLAEFRGGAGLLRVITDVGREQLSVALAESVGRLDALAAGPPPASELRRAQLDVLRELGGPASSGRLAGHAARMLMLGRPLEALDEAAREAARVSPEQVRAAAVACRGSLQLAAVADPGALRTGTLPGFVVEELP